MSIIPLIPMTPEEHDTILEELLVHPVSGSSAPSAGAVIKTKEGFLFTGLEYAPGKTENLVLRGLLRNATGELTVRTRKEWQTGSGNADMRLITSQELYQVMRRLYECRDSLVNRESLDGCVAMIRKDIRRHDIYCGTSITYIGTSCTIMHHDGLSDPQTVLAPEFTSRDDWWTHLTLAHKQPKAALGTCNPIPQNAQAVFNALLGPGYEEAGAVLQHLIETAGCGELRSVGFATPTMQGRSRHPDRALTLGISFLGTILIGADATGSWPAYGVNILKYHP